MQNSPKIAEGFFQKHIIALIMWGLLAVIGILLFSDFSKGPVIISEKIDPYVLSTKGETFIFRDTARTVVSENKQAPLFVGDRVRTLNSTATIYWPDGSITRLGEKSTIKINEMSAKTANENIQIDFSLEEGKSWSNVIKYMFGESHFHERFNNDTALAAVRGTVFEVNLDGKYIHTIDHAISVEDIGSHTGSTFIVAGGVLDTDTRNALMKSKIDAVWNKANSDADIIYLNERLESLKKTILESAGRQNFMNLFLQEIGLQEAEPSLEVLVTEGKTDWTYFQDAMRTKQNPDKLMDIYQQFYGLQNTEKLLDTKIKLRDLIIETAPTEKKKALLTDFARSTLYDSWDTIRIGSGSIEGLQKKLEDYIKQGADENLIESLKKASADEHLQKFNNALENIKDATIETFGKTNLLDEAKKEITAPSLEKINDTATDIRKGITDGFEKLTR